MADSLEKESLEVIAADLSKVYLQAVYSVASIVVAERDSRNKDKAEAAPPTLPLELAGLSEYEFTELLSEHEQRLKQTVAATVVEEHISAEFRLLLRTLIDEPTFKSDLDKASKSSGGDFGVAWKPAAGSRFRNLLNFAAGLATVMPGTATVESDFSIINYERDSYRSALTSFSLEGIHHSRQLEDIRKTFTRMVETE